MSQRLCDKQTHTNARCEFVWMFRATPIRYLCNSIRFYCDPFYNSTETALATITARTQMRKLCSICDFDDYNKHRVCHLLQPIAQCTHMYRHVLAMLAHEQPKNSHSKIWAWLSVPFQWRFSNLFFKFNPTAKYKQLSTLSDRTNMHNTYNEKRFKNGSQHTHKHTIMLNQ